MKSILNILNLILNICKREDDGSLHLGTYEVQLLNMAYVTLANMDKVINGPDTVD